ncbi:alpha/beta fold hydrolase [Bradyrhizobium elkanii]|uniref:alpha/beta fold hydrolase n=1 Tax=Bradyrhizobium elkanii TaxID=29448 RepID=UPI001BA8C6AB|nr:alpha/beta fold hydrolase [Bradyrhizobium elkanii]
MNADARFLDVARFVRQAIAQETKLPEEQLRGDEPFETFGIESVLSVAIVRRLEETFGELSKTLLFEYQTIDGLAAYLLRHHASDARRFEANASRSPAPAPKIAPDAPVVDADAPTRPGRPFASEAATVQDQTAGPAATPRAADPGDIAIIGMSGRFPYADTLEQFWDNLCAGRDCITEIPDRLWDWRDYWSPEQGADGKSYAKWGGFIADSDCFDPLFFNISNLQASSMDPQERLFLETVHHTLEDAGYTREALRGRRVGLYVSAMWSDYQHYGARDAKADSSFAFIANRASYFFDLRGPSIALDTTCSGSLITVHLACESLRTGESDLAVAGGVNVTCHPHKYLVLSRTGFAASDGRCRSFGAEGSGYVPGDGVGALLLKPLAAAIADGDRIHAVIKSTCINHGGRANGFTVPSADAQSALIDAALRKASIDPRSISYIEAHAPGTALGDPIELRALAATFRKYTGDDKFCAIGSVKSNIGHLESAAGFASIAKVVLQLQHRQLVPSIHSDRLNPNVQLENTPFYLQRDLSAWQAPVVEHDGRSTRHPRRAGINAFGAGGANAHVIIEEYTAPAHQRATTHPQQLIVLSAKTAERLRAVAERLLADVTRRLSQPAISDDGVPERRIVELISELTRVRPSLLAPEDCLRDVLSDQRALDTLAARIRSELRLAFAAQPDLGWTIGELVEAAAGSRSASGRSSAGGSELLEQIAFTLQVGREAMSHRFAAVAQSLPELQQILSGYLADQADLPSVWQGSVQNAAAGFATRPEEERYIAQLVANRRLDRLGQLWCKGVSIPWAALFADPKPARIALPLYPFARERCWVDTPAASVAADLQSVRSIAMTPFSTGEPASPRGVENLVLGTADIRNLVFRPKWEPIAAERIGGREPRKGAETGAMLIVYPPSAAIMTEALRPQLAEGMVYEIVLGCRTELVSGRKWEVDVFDANAIAACVSFMGDLDSVYFLGGCYLGDKGPETKAAFDAVQAQSVLSLHRLVRALNDRKPSIRPPQLKIVTNYAVGVNAGDRVVPYAAGIGGFARAIIREFPGLAAELVDVDASPGESETQLAIAMRAVVKGAGGQTQYAIRSGRRWSRKLRPYKPPEGPRGVFKHDGVYLLVGGAGTVGSQISRCLANAAQARLVWIGRRACDDAIASRMSEVERLGGRVTYVAADAAEVTQLERVVEEIEREHGRIDGVLHLAMNHIVTRIQNLGEEQLKETLAAKVDSTFALHSVLRQRDPGFVALFSSAEANIGNVGWGAYAAACSFQDAFALSWASEAAYPVLSINWGYWENEAPEVGEMLAAKGIYQLSAEQGLTILERALANRTDQLTALNVSDEVLERMDIVREVADDRDKEARPAIVAPAATISAPPILPTKAPAAPRAEPAVAGIAAGAGRAPALGDVSRALAGLLANVLRIDKARLETDVDLVNYGVDSLIVVAIHKSLEKVVGPLPATLFINFQTINEIGSHLLDQHPQAVQALLRTGADARSEPPRPPPTQGTAPSPAGSRVKLLRLVGSAESARYLDEYGAAYRTGELERAAAAASSYKLSASAAGDALAHLLVDTPTARNVEVLCVGNGAPVMLLPAVGLVAPTWKNQIVSHFPRSMRLSVPHPPGYGLTKPIKDCSTRGIAATFKDVIDVASPHRPVHVVASCLGCVSALYLARTIPDRIASLTLIGAFHDTSDMIVADPDKLSADELTNLLETAVVRIKDDFAGMTFSGAVPPYGTSADYLLNNFCANSLIALRYLTEMLTLPVLDWLPEIRVPTLCVYGSSDKIVNPKQSRTISEAIPHAELVAIDGAGHFPYLTHSDQFNPMMEQFVVQHERTRNRRLN